MKIKRNVEKRREKIIAHKKYQLFARVCVFVCSCVRVCLYEYIRFYCEFNSKNGANEYKNMQKTHKRIHREVSVFFCPEFRVGERCYKLSS